MPSSAQARRFYRLAKQRFDDVLLLLEKQKPFWMPQSKS